MAKSLVIVESPAKAKTLTRYLGEGFEVMASYGHVRDLLPKSGAVKPDKNFEMQYEIIDKNAKSVEAIAKALKNAETLYLATDPDREGEAISWHLKELLEAKGALKGKDVKRVVFHEVTKSAVQEAIRNPRDLSTDLINAQQARRALDYLVGFNLSPLLWKKVQRGLSAGRVQSPALRLIVERELEIEKFKSREYWTIEADLAHKDCEFTAKLSLLRGEKLRQFSIENTADADAATEFLRKSSDGKLSVLEVEKKQRKRQPSAPFITSTLQQEAVRKLGFTAQKAMRVAQQLYEGIDTGEGAVGLITYMRTDSVTLANEALAEIRDYIVREFGADHLPDQPRVFKTTSKNAQEAHEAIRPTSVARTPKSIKAKLTPEQFRLYDLIWKRALASQMEHATIDTVAVDMGCGDGNVFRATGSTIVNLGFMAVYQESRDEDGAGTGTDPDSGPDIAESKLPPLQAGDQVPLKQIRGEQHFTEPPPRYGEASLVKALEEYGIGRPSTYASIISTLRNRGYVDMDKKRFIPTDVARIVNRFLTEHFRNYVDYDFTARLEDELDAVSRGEENWIPLMQRFWQPFSETVKDKEENVSRSDIAQARVLGNDPASGLPVSVRMGRYGPFAQIGTRDDENKPRFAGLRPMQRIDTISLQEALDLFKLPRNLGNTPEGEEIVINIGRFGPYVRFGSRFASLKKEDDPYTVGLERALQLITDKKAADAAKRIKVFDGTEVAILNGRYGPYITDGKGRNARIPKDREPASLTLEESLALLEQAPPPRPRRGQRPAKAAKVAKPKAEKIAKAEKPPAAAKTKKKAKKAAKKAKAGKSTKSAKTVQDANEATGAAGKS